MDLFLAFLAFDDFSFFFDSSRSLFLPLDFFSSRPRGFSSLRPPLLQRVRWPCSPPHLLLHPCPRSGIGEFPGTPDKEVQVFDAIEIELWVHQSCIIITDRSFAYQGTLSEGKPTPSQPLSLFHDSQDSLLLVQISLVGPSSYTL